MAEGAAGPTLAVFTKNRSNPAYAAARLGADRVAGALGARTLHYVPAIPDDPEQQAALVDEALAQRPDAVVFVPVHPTAVNAAIRKITRAGVPLIGFLNRFSAATPLCWVGADDYAIGRELGTYLCQHLGGRGELVVLEGGPHLITSVERVRGFRDAVERFPDVHVVATICGQYLRDPAQRAAAQLIGSGRSFDGVFAANDEMALGMIAALEHAGRSSIVVGVNAIPEAIAALKQSKLLATADFNAMNISALATHAAIRHVRGEALPREILLPVAIVDARNYREWDKPFEERALVNWHEALAAS